MPRKPPEIKTLYPLQHEYFDSLKRYQGEVLMLLNACETGLDLNCIKEPFAAKLRERVEALKVTMSE